MSSPRKSLHLQDHHNLAIFYPLSRRLRSATPATASRALGTIASPVRPHSRFHVR